MVSAIFQVNQSFGKYLVFHPQPLMEFGEADHGIHGSFLFVGKTRLGS